MYIFVIISIFAKISSDSENDGFTIFAPNQEALSEAKEMVDKLLAEKSEPVLEFGAIYKAKVVEVREIGVMVTLYPSMQPALVHNSQLDQRKVHRF
jgi:polyribonucleotide nucleotidyltransferase